MEYIDGLKEYREIGNVDHLIELFLKEQDEYAEKVEYFFGDEE